MAIAVRMTTAIPLAMAPMNITISWMMTTNLMLQTMVMMAKMSLPMPSTMIGLRGGKNNFGFATKEHNK